MINEILSENNKLLELNGISKSNDLSKFSKLKLEEKRKILDLNNFKSEKRNNKEILSVKKKLLLRNEIQNNNKEFFKNENKTEDIKLYKSLDLERKKQIRIMLERHKKIKLKDLEKEKKLKESMEKEKIKKLEEKRRKQEEKKKLVEIWEEEIKKRISLKIIEKENEELLKNKYLEEIQKKKEEIRIEREKRKELRNKLELALKLKEEKELEELKKIKLDMQKKKLEISESIKQKQIQIKEIKKIKENEEEKKLKINEDKINDIINQLKIKAKNEKELEKEEESLDNSLSKHIFRLTILNKLVNQYLNIYKTNDINNILEIINKIGKLFKKEINYDKIFSKENFFYVSEARKSENIIIHFLGVIGEEFRKFGIYSIVDKKSEDSNLMSKMFKVLLSKYSILPKYEIQIKSKELISTFSKNEKEYLNFIEKFRKKIKEEYSILDTNIYIISNRIDLFSFTFVILNRPALNLKRYENTFGINVNKDSLLEYIKLSEDFFENEYNRDINSWEKNNLKRGGEKYSPPYGWKGIALKVLNEFDNGDNSWLGNEGKEGEWAVAYHGIGNGNEFKKLINIILNNLRNGPRQLYANLNNIRKNDTLIGKGVYLAPEIKEAEKYSSKIQLGEGNSDFQFIIMCRVKPDKIREPDKFPINWIIDDDYNSLRPYRILIKES